MLEMVWELGVSSVSFLQFWQVGGLANTKIIHKMNKPS
jgi:hypothetical protein